MFISELQLGELVHHQTLFGLLEAMSAIEMMDPKMDAGLRCNKDPEGPLTFTTAVAVSKSNWNGNAKKFNNFIHLFAFRPTESNWPRWRAVK